jgi:hypothetical protein
MAAQTIAREVAERLLKTSRHVGDYIAVLDIIADGFEKDPNKSAYNAIVAAYTFLERLGTHPRLRAAFVEARSTIQRDRKAETLFGQRQIRDLHDSAIVSLLNEEGLTLDEATKKIYDRDPAEARRLKDFRNNMRKTPGANRNIYHLLKKDFRKRFPTNTGTRALRIARAMRGKKG